MQQQLSGVVHGNAIVLDGPPLLPEGQRVEVIVREWSEKSPRTGTSPEEDESTPEWWTDEDDRILQEIYHARKQGRRGETA
jgi:hypothetical protein